jgi:pimeloyl-ACP methyl ester carboxylesterase
MANHREFKLSPNGVVLGTAAALAAMALYNVFRARSLERAHPPSGRFVNVNGVRLHYLERGAGPPVVLVHGNMVTAEDFDLSGVLTLAAGRHRVIAIDRPGFGYSDRPHGATWTPAAQAHLLRQALAALDINRPVVLGHSFGATVALALALDYPSSVSGLVLLSGYYHPTLRADALLSGVSALPVIGDVIRYTVSPIVGAMMLPLHFKAMFSPLSPPGRFADSFAPGMALRPWQIRAESQDGAVMVPGALAMSRRYRDLVMPIVIMAGTEDHVVNVERQAVRLHKEITHSILRLLPKVGHMIHYAEPELVAEAVETAYEQATAAGRDGRPSEKVNSGASPRA